MVSKIVAFLSFMQLVSMIGKVDCGAELNLKTIIIIFATMAIFIFALYKAGVFKEVEWEDDGNDF